MVRFVLASCVVVGVVGCSRDLQLPDPPTPRLQPTITRFSPRSAFAGDRVVVYGENFDESGNQLIFAAGISVFADSLDGGGDVILDGGMSGKVQGLSFQVPLNLETTEKLVVVNTQGRSAPSEEPFYPLGNGYPTIGAPVATLKFRHDPVGIIDRLENVLMASSLFDIALTDGKASATLPGKPLSLVGVVADRDQGLVSVRTENGSAMVLVDAATGAPIATSNSRTVIDELVLPAPAPLVGRSIGRELSGDYRLYEWRYDGVTLSVVSATSRLLPIRELLDASALGADVVVVGLGLTGPQVPQVFVVPTLGSIAPVFPWLADGGRPCDPMDELACTGEPDGPVALVPQSDGGTSIVASLSTGDLVVVDAQRPEAREGRTLISYAPIDDLAAGVSPDKFVFTKSRDGALFQYDLTSPDLEWATPVRGQPTRISVAPDIDEIAVANRTENSVDTIIASTGQWTGRIAFDLGVGAAPGHVGGVVPTYTYDPDRAKPVEPPATYYPDETMDLLMRNVGLVLTFNASSLELGRLSLLEPVETAGAPLRLMVMQQNPTGPFETLVLRQLGIGLLEEDAAGGGRTERIVSSTFPETPTDALVLADGSIVVAFPGSVRSYTWVGAASNRRLQVSGIFGVTAPNTVKGIARKGSNVIVVEALVGPVTLYRVTERRLPMLEPVDSGVTLNAVTGEDQFQDFLRAVTLREGPALLFGNGRLGTQLGPVVWFPSDTVAPTNSIIRGREVTGVSPDGRYIVWRDVDGPEPMVRLTSAEPNGPITPFSTYRLASHTAGPDFDPSGEWLFLPLPGTDQLDVVQ